MSKKTAEQSATVYVAGKRRAIVEDQHHNKTIKIGSVVLTAHDAMQLARELATGDQLSDLADTLKRAEYYSEVRDYAASLAADLKDGSIEDREALLERLHEDVDGSHRIIYTAAAQDCIRYSDNDGAYVDDFGAEGLVEDGQINWSRMAFSAFERDIIEQLEADGVDVNCPFKCDADDCDETFDSFAELNDHKADEHAADDDTDNEVR